MTFATVRSAAEHIARQGRILPHQLAALSALDRSLSDEQRQAFTDDWRAAGSPAAPVPAAGWIVPARKIVREFEGCVLNAYRCPAGIWTIGWGSTTIDGKAVREGQAISQAQADAQLDTDLQRFYDALVRAIPAVGGWSSNRAAALVSWVYNVGVGAMQDSTLRRRILAGEHPPAVVQQELPRWNRADGVELPGLTRRRAAEVALFLGGEPQAPSKGVWALQVPHYAQLDSATDQARRMCFSSSCAMLVAFLRPGVLSGPNGDDQYLKRVQTFGDTTNPIAQTQALRSYEINASFVKNADFDLIERQIDTGLPVPCGYLHRGPIANPSGGGHWLIVVGYDSTHVVVHDPLGEADLVSGTTLNRPARFARYSRQNWGRRWMVEGPGTGWAVVVKR
jgi:GH24 family phage-related lysozyme (muramidase)